MKFNKVVAFKYNGKRRMGPIVNAKMDNAFRVSHITLFDYSVGNYRTFKTEKIGKVSVLR